MLEIVNVCKKYDETVACSNINLSINKGEFFTLLGPSGCGKTTLLRLIAGFETADTGTINMNKKNIVHTPVEKRCVSMVFQNYALFPHMNVFDNVAYGLKMKKLKKDVINSKVEKYLDLVNLSSYENRKIADLSGGEQQRVALARALIVEPDLLLLDEPLSNLDAKLKDKMRLELKNIQRKVGITTIFVTHDQNEALIISDKIAVFNKGLCLQVGTPSEIYEKPVDEFVATFVGETNTLLIDNRRFLIRPQYIAMSPHIGTYKGRIESMIITGVLIEYYVLVEKQSIKVVTINNKLESNKFKIDETVYLSFDENRRTSFEG